MTEDRAVELINEWLNLAKEVGDILFLGSVALSFGWLAHLCISDKDFNIKTGFIFAGMLVLIGLTCYATLNWN